MSGFAPKGECDIEKLGRSTPTYVRATHPTGGGFALRRSYEWNYMVATCPIGRICTASLLRVSNYELIIGALGAGGRGGVKGDGGDGGRWHASRRWLE